ncbi:unnamed protein product [Brassicogethes aeneus]|uniref:Zinc transporter foi n=1 Tax=Brassicogethes aeneus TaxID=1431903 RepID=A0A9P0AY25_BRAAE|nr:unnamed protein product [Brassicogethes aeneus]
MSRQVISVCIFCFICATHSPCASHASVERENVRLGGAVYHDPNNPPLVDNLQGGLKDQNSALQPAPIGSPYDDIARKLTTKRKRREESDEYVQKIFKKFGDGDVLTIEGFNKLVQKLDLMPLISDTLDKHDVSDVHKQVGDEEKADNSTCSSHQALKYFIDSKNSTENGTFDGTDFAKSCPVLVYSMLTDSCRQHSHRHSHLAEDHRHTPNKVNGMVWFYSILAVIVISACGLLALIIIPLMQKRFYKPLIQFLVALAVGTLAGDALLHLLPHAMSTGSEAEHHHGPGGDENMWKGFVAMMGLTFFFVMERVILLIGKWRKSKQRKSAHSHVRVVNETCMDKYNSIPYCFQDIMQDTKTKYYDADKTGTTMVDLGSNSDGQSFKKSHSANIEKPETNQNMTQCTSGDTACTESNKMLPGGKRDDHQDIMVILREHETSHHGHSHAHGHVHAAPQNFSAVAWMVIMGDGLHNFTDGMAIGAAFSGSLAGGFSTTVAVFCHELPHELGDFAMLLKAGMTIKQAVFYNLLSSVLCIFGNIFGVWLGNTEYASSWVFAAAAGMFLYIALVDMIPELSSAHEDESNITQCILHLSGLFLGVGIMTLIAFYEHDLKNIFRDPV